MSVRTDPLRLLRARWCLLAAAQPVLAAGGAPLPFRVTVDGTERGVARYDASSTAGATLAWFGPDRAVLSCGDLGWHVPGAPGAAERMAGGPSWLEHVSALDHRLSAGRYGWAGVWDGGGFDAGEAPEPGAPLPPVGSADEVVAALAGRLENGDGLQHVVRMCEYEWLDAASWRAAFGGFAPERMLDEAWLRLREWGLTQWTGDGPRYDGVPGRTPERARAVAAEHARERGMQIPEEVRVESALRTRTGWRVRFLDYRDVESGRPLVISVPDTGPAWIDTAARVIRIPGTRPD
ncbi:hypothetical protein TPB0596_46310 [Tsukamurella pulmonis]|uniref:hypothetical protein n=1 Tax=Tsukamurella pulmonis TaxID=47312 RepID=UPI000796784E|nr:hypothetical protein [Tsukamurella pulmonis]KXP08308.1 hypothetical protein AXK57_17785 [Tsukamurella pulmonis]RDH10211.1 hypothetical protein DVB88_18965 [Tsukamurella pulmonis]BDD84868.1 hypothetical protein TPB0596_46310 [Tsukamurella pulmonis]